MTMIAEFLGVHSIMPIIQAMIGGFILNMMNVYEDHKKPKNRRVSKDTIYYVVFLFWPFAGGALAWIYMSSGYRIDGILAFTTGLTAPVVIQSMMQKAFRSKEEYDDAEDE
jgi:hypothetical protein